MTGGAHQLLIVIVSIALTVASLPVSANAANRAMTGRKATSAGGRRTSSPIRRHSTRKFGRVARKHPKRSPSQIGIVIATEEGEIIQEQLADVEFNPASVTKVITAYGAIRKFGLDHQFNTNVWRDGLLDESGTLVGNIYVQGLDPDLRRSDAHLIRKLLSEAGIKRIEGRLIVSSGFSYNSGPDPLWSARRLVQDWSTMPGPQIHVTRGVTVGQPSAASELLWTHKSESLRSTLKTMLSFSKNAVAEQLGHVSGGVRNLESTISKEAGLPHGALKLASSSGLGKGRVKPRHMLKILQTLRSELLKDGSDLKDILPLAGIDPGTLDGRFTGIAEKGSVVAKTGTLPGTDGGTSTLAGMFRCKRENYYFVIFCWRGSVSAFRYQQDQIIRQLQASRGGAMSFASPPGAVMVHEVAAEPEEVHGSADNGTEEIPDIGVVSELPPEEDPSLSREGN